MQIETKAVLMDADTRRQKEWKRAERVIIYSLSQVWAMKTGDRLKNACGNRLIAKRKFSLKKKKGKGS